MKKLIEKIRSWSTTKKSFWFAICFMIIYVIVGLVMSWFGHAADETLTTETFETIRLIITAGGVLSGAKIVKNK